ncbi:MAG: hypothetical protein WAO00_12530 [Chthoniobacterales bacterium]
MALTIQTASPNALLTAIKKAIDEKHVETWTYDDAGDFTHTPSQWKNRAWLRPKMEAGTLRFGLVGQQGVAMSKLIYGVYHGRFIEMLLVHFDDSFSIARASAVTDSSIDNFI